MRYEIRMGEDDPDELAGARALSEAELFLRTMGFGYRDLKTVVMDMADVWSGRAGLMAASDLYDGSDCSWCYVRAISSSSPLETRRPSVLSAK